MSSSTASESADAAAVDAAPPTTWKLAANRPLAALLVVNIFYNIDRNILNMLIEPIRLEFGLSDGEMGMLTGIAFAVSYALMTFPVGHLTDRYNRVGILAIAVSFWSLCTALFGIARSYLELILYRIGVACGEAAGFIPMQSLLGDLYPPSRRAAAIGILLAGGGSGQLLAYAAAGYMNDAIGWRWTFITLGLAGVIIGPLLRLGMKEPRRGASEGLTVDVTRGNASIWQALRMLLGRPAMRGVVAGMTIASITGYAMMTWLPTYFMRRFDLSTTDSGLLTSVVIILPGLVGLILGGFVADRLFSRNPFWIVRFPALVMCIAGPMLAAVVFAPTMMSAMLVGILPGFLIGVYPAALLTAIHYIAGIRLRGSAGALITFALLLVGQGFGPAITGLLSDLFAGDGNQPGYESLRNSLAGISTLFVVGGCLLLLFTRTLVTDMEQARRYDEAAG